MIGLPSLPEGALFGGGDGRSASYSSSISAKSPSPRSSWSVVGGSAPASWLPPTTMASSGHGRHARSLSIASVVSSASLPSASVPEEEDRHPPFLTPLYNNQHHFQHFHISDSQNGYVVPLDTIKLFENAPGAGPGYVLHKDFLEKYLLGMPLGVGSSGFVIAATRIRDDYETAVKFIHKDRLPFDGWIRDRGLGIIPIEAYILKRLSHPNVVQFIEIFEDSSFFYLVMEAIHSSNEKPDDPTRHQSICDITITAMCESPDPDVVVSHKAVSLPRRTSTSKPCPSVIPRSPLEHQMPRRASVDLFDIIDRRPKGDLMPTDAVHKIFKQVCLAVHHIHSRGFAHRDLKDENVIVGEGDRVVVVDFGSARQAKGMFSTFDGTATYRPPEALKGSGLHHGQSADVFSLGVMLYIMLESVRPYGDSSDRTVIPVVRSKRPPECIDLVCKMLNPDPDDRIKMGEVLAHPWLVGDTIP